MTAPLEFNPETDLTEEAREGLGSWFSDGETVRLLAVDDEAIIDADDGEEYDDKVYVPIDSKHARRARWRVEPWGEQQDSGPAGVIDAMLNYADTHYEKALGIRQEVKVNDSSIDAQALVDAAEETKAKSERGEGADDA
jgi:hypothetical protein